VIPFGANNFFSQNGRWILKICPGLKSSGKLIPICTCLCFI
jgi:hypothetical protein